MRTFARGEDPSPRVLPRSPASGTAGPAIRPAARLSTGSGFVGRLVWPFLDARGELAVGWLVAADLILWAAWLSSLLLFTYMPPATGLVWVLLLAGGFSWRYTLRSPPTGARRHIGLARGFGAASVATVAAAAVAVAVFGQFWDIVYRRLPGVPAPPASALDAYAAAPLGLAVVAIVFVAAGPLMEELCFRGWVMPAITRRYGVIAGVAISSLLFAAAHARPLWIPYFFVAGTLFAISSHLTGSVWTGVALHAGYNALCMLLEPVFPTPESISDWSDGLGAGRGSAVVGMAITAGALVLLARRVRRDAARPGP